MSHGLFTVLMSHFYVTDRYLLLGSVFYKRLYALAYKERSTRHHSHHLAQPSTAAYLQAVVW